MPPSALVEPVAPIAPPELPRARVIAERRLPPTPSAPRPLRIADVTLFYGERSGGIRTYLEAKAAYAARTGAFEHHMLVPGHPDRGDGARHELRSLACAGGNGYRVPLGAATLQRTLHALSPDIVLLHDPFWAPRAVARAAHLAGAVVVAVHHATPALQAASVPGPQRAYERALRRWYTRAYADVDAIMSVVDPRGDCGRAATLPLRLGLDPAFCPQPHVRRGEHVLYAGRLALEKGLRELLDAAAAAPEPWPLVLRGAGQYESALRERVQRLGLDERVSFEPFLADRRALAREFARAACVALPGPHETFGLAGLEAAACGARLVTAASAPCAAHVGPLADTFIGGDAEGLLRALERARARPRDLTAAAEVAERHGWARSIDAELADLRMLV